MYRIIFTEEAQKDLQMLQRKAPYTLKKLKSLLIELQEHPRIGTGQIEQLKYYEEETWSRRINKEHRLLTSNLPCLSKVQKGLDGNA